jgi:hypothetical protein
MSIFDNIEITVSVHQGKKCPRCWHYHHLRDTPDDLCERCMMILADMNMPIANDIRAYYQAERKKYCTRQDKSTCKHEKCCMDEMVRKDVRIDDL